MDGMDELLDRAYTQEQAEQDKETQQALLLSDGFYRTIPEVTLTSRQSDRVFVTENGTKRGRLEFRYFAQVQHEMTGEKGGIGFTISPDKVLTERGRPDSASSRWAQAVTAYRVALGREPESWRDITSFIRDYAVRLRIRRLDGNERFPEPSNFVAALQAVRE